MSWKNTGLESDSGPDFLLASCITLSHVTSLIVFLHLQNGNNNNNNGTYPAYLKSDY